MRISTSIAIIAFSATFVVARPLNSDLYDTAIIESEPKVDWTDLTPSEDNEADRDSSYYKEFPNTEDQKIRAGRSEKQKYQITEPSKSNEMDINMENIQPKSTKQVLKNEDKAMELNEMDNQDIAKDFSDNNISPSDTKYVFDIIKKPDESTVKESHSDTALNIGTRNDFTKNESTSDTTDYASKEPIDQDPTVKTDLKMEKNDNVYIPTEEVLPIQDEKQSSSLDFYDALDQAIDSDINSEVYQEPVKETITNDTPLDEVFDYHSLITEQIRSAEEQIRLKQYEILQDQQQVDDLKLKIHHSPTSGSTTTSSSPDPTFSMEIVESGPNETVYVYKVIAPTITATVDQFDISSKIISITNQLPHSTNTPILSTQISLSSEKKENEAEQLAPSLEINNMPLYKLVQKQTNEDYQTKIKNSSANEAVDLVTHMSDTTFDSSNKLKLPNGSWTPSCKNVSKGLYCLRPDGEGSTIVECLGENIGFGFSCGKNMLCYSAGPFDVDCQKEQSFITEK